jgi:hypothetical protein
MTIPPAVALMRRLGMEPDSWQIEVLESRRKQVLLYLCRQAGRSTVAALLTLAEGGNARGDPADFATTRPTAAPP